VVSKGTAAQIIVFPYEIPVTNCPKTLYVEGLNSPGRAVLEASYIHDTANITGKLVINVVDLQEKQAGERKSWHSPSSCWISQAEKIFVKISSDWNVFWEENCP
jgi:hypothetical protein